MVRIGVEQAHVLLQRREIREAARIDRPDDGDKVRCGFVLLMWHSEVQARVCWCAAYSAYSVTSQEDAKHGHTLSIVTPSRTWSVSFGCNKEEREEWHKVISSIVAVQRGKGSRGGRNSLRG